MKTVYLATIRAARGQLSSYFRVDGFYIDGQLDKTTISYEDF